MSCHKKEPQAVYACLGFGVGVASTRLLAGRQWCRGTGVAATARLFLGCPYSGSGVKLIFSALSSLQQRHYLLLEHLSPFYRRSAH